MVRYFLIIILSGIVGLTVAQQPVPKVSSAALKNLEKARSAMQNSAWDEARKLSERLVRQSPEWTEGWKALAEACQGGGDLRAGEIALNHLVSLDSTGYPEAWRWLAQWAFNRGDYVGARRSISQYVRLNRDSTQQPYEIALLRASIRFAWSQESLPVNLTTKLEGPVNTGNDEYFPSLSVDGSVLSFTRQVKVIIEGTRLPGKEDLLYVDLMPDGYTDPKFFPPPINSDGNEGTQCLSQDGRIMFFTACNRQDSKGGCDLYYCVKSGDKWSDPVNLGYPVNTRYWESTPFLAADGKHLYFSSNRPGGVGGMDLWVSTLQPDRSWSAPGNLGSPVNTRMNELSPFLLADGKTLFFASNGHPGMGGFDLYRDDLSAIKGASAPQNLGSGINTWKDEDALTINALTGIGLFASNRDSVSGKDIYQVDLQRFIPSGPVFVLSGKVLDRGTGMPVGARIEMQPHGDSLISRVDSDPVTGTFLMGIPEKPSYRIGVWAEGYLPYSELYIQESRKGDSGEMRTIYLDAIRQGASIILHNIFFTIDSYELLPESFNDLTDILNLFRQNPGIVVEIAGFTDNTGTDEHNLILSQHRAESVMNYLINQGIKPVQVRAMGYGSENPVASNDTEEGRGLNRRTEIRIIRLNKD